MFLSLGHTALFLVVSVELVISYVNCKECSCSSGEGQEGQIAGPWPWPRRPQPQARFYHLKHFRRFHSSSLRIRISNKDNGSILLRSVFLKIFFLWQILRMGTEHFNSCLHGIFLGLVQANMHWALADYNSAQSGEQSCFPFISIPRLNPVSLCVGDMVWGKNKKKYLKRWLKFFPRR